MTLSDIFYIGKVKSTRNTFDTLDFGDKNLLNTESPTSETFHPKIILKKN